MEGFELLRLLLLTIVSGSITVSHVSASHCQNEVFVGEDYCFRLGTIPLPFLEARLYCAESFIGSELASLRNAADRQKVVAYLKHHFTDKYVPAQAEPLEDNFEEESKISDLKDTQASGPGDGKDSTTPGAALDSDSAQTEAPKVKVSDSSAELRTPENQTSSQQKDPDHTAVKALPGNGKLDENEAGVAKRDSPRTDAVDAGSGPALDPKSERSPETTSRQRGTTESLMGNSESTARPVTKDWVTAEFEEVDGMEEQPFNVVAVLMEQGVWMGAYRDSKDSPLFSWMRNGGYVSLRAEKNADCVFLDPKDQYALKATDCNLPILPLCQLLSCPKSYCLNGGRCLNGTCLCPDHISGKTCEIMPKVVERPPVVQAGARTIPGVDEGHRNLFIALLVTVGVGSLFIVLVLSKDRLRRVFRRPPSTLEGEREAEGEEAALGTATLTQAAVEIEEVDVAASLAAVTAETPIIPPAAKESPPAVCAPAKEEV